MKVRMHRGSLAESMGTVEDIQPFEHDLVEYLRRYGAPDGLVVVEPYTYDYRIGWNTHIVLIDGCPWAWTDEPVYFPGR